MGHRGRLPSGPGRPDPAPRQRDSPEVERLLAGIDHGSHGRSDLLADVDPWEHVGAPLVEVRRRFNGLPPGLEPEGPPV